jgi:TonB family protein
MAGKSLLTPLRVASLIVVFGLMEAPLGLMTAWASGHEQPGSDLIAQRQPMARQAPMSSPPTGSVLLQQSPRTIDEYAALVQNRLQVAAMEMRQQGTAELRLTIGKDGSVLQTEIVEIEGPAALRDQVRQLVDRIAPLPTLPENVDTLVVQTDLAFDYPGENLMDRFGRLP